MADDLEKRAGFRPAELPVVRVRCPEDGCLYSASAESDEAARASMAEHRAYVHRPKLVIAVCSECFYSASGMNEPLVRSLMEFHLRAVHGSPALTAIREG